MQLLRHVHPFASRRTWTFCCLTLACLLPACERPEEAANLETPPEHRTNRLIREKSPYLLQHAHNPVDWYPWGDEAFARARQENKPIFLSIGYSTCHWCHVMERESFEDETIAAFLNENFVSIKVDREERPDIDRIYMAFVQATTGGGGWPMSVWLTPDRKPFFGGTYFPPERVGNRPGFLEVLRFVSEQWSKDSASIHDNAERMLAELRSRSRLHARMQGEPPALETSFIDSAAAVQKGRFDSRYGGFGTAPKFPRPSELLFLHRVHVRNQDPEAFMMAQETLLAMAEGGIRDQLGGGFHRYSTDAFWRLPHFEKMLYDQAQLVVAFLEAYQLSGEERLATIARGILDDVRREFTDAAGGFYSALDADSPNPDNPAESLEGVFYTWKHQELVALLNPTQLEIVERHYDVRPEGNLNEHEFAGSNVLFVAEPLSEVADSLRMSDHEIAKHLREIRSTLLAARAKRPSPHLDDKILTAWNGLMISAFARAHQVLERDEDRTTAVRAAEFVLENLWDAERRILLRRYRDGEADIAGFNVDYANMVQALLDLYETTFEFRWLEWAQRLCARQIELFSDPEHGGFFETTDEDSSLLLRSKEEYDGAEPTSNSVTVLNLLRLAEITDSATDRDLAAQTLQLYAPTLQRFGTALPAMLVALDFHLSAGRQVIVAGRPGAPDTTQLLRAVHQRFLPNTILLLADGGEGQRKLARLLPLLESITPQSGRATAYVCQNYTCQLPVTTVEGLVAQLDAEPMR